jgi:RHS repeat-associated protein
VGWGYDNIYRLTSEDITTDPNSKTGSVTYGLDPVGNRLSLGLSPGANLPGISPIQSGSITYDFDDRLSTETYDNNGNTLITGARTFTYDFENRLKTMTNSQTGATVTIVYDGDGNRVAKTVNGMTTQYLVDDLNPTGYAQVVEELTAGAVSRTYTYGLQRVSQNQQISNAWTPAFYGYDGFGSVRTLTDSTGTVTDTYDYDAWGNTVNTTGSTPNVYLYRGEQYDPDLRLYYLRARYLNPLSGRFLTRDPGAGRTRVPVTLHKYLYAGGNPINRTDPTGRDMLPYVLLVGALAAEAGAAAGEMFAGAAEWATVEAAEAASIMADLAVAAFEEAEAAAADAAGLAEAAAADLAAAWSEIVAAVNEFNVVIREASKLGTAARVIACMDLGLLAENISGHWVGDKFGHIVEWVGTGICGFTLETTLVQH